MDREYESVEESKDKMRWTPTLRWLNVVSFIGTVTLNALASTGAISGKGIGDVSRQYQTEITPASYAFSIWGVIYTLVALFCIFQALPQQQSSELIFIKIGWLFPLSNLFNVLWIMVFCWGTEATTWVSTPLIAGILVTLVLAHQRCQSWLTADRTVAEVVCIDCMLSMYGGWVTVATVVNTSAAFVSSGATTLGWTASGWTIVMLVIAAIINLLMLWRCNDSIWGLVFTWASVAISHDTPTKEAQTAALTLAIIVGSLCVMNAAFRLFKFFITDSNRLNWYEKVNKSPQPSEATRLPGAVA